MRIFHLPALGLIASTFVTLFCLASRAGAEPVPQVIQVLQVRGQARYSNDNKTWHSLKKGEVLQPGSMIQTAEKSTVDLQLGDPVAAPASIDGPNGVLRTPEELKANIVRLYENSVLDVGKLTSERSAAGEVSETQLELRAGKIMGGVRKSSTASLYEIKFLKGVAGIRGGVYLMNSSGEVNVLYGTAMIALEAADGSMPVKLVAANHQFDPGTGLVTEIRSPLPVEPLGANPRPAVAAVAPSTPASPASPISPAFQGSGMGGSLRKF